MPTGIYIRTKKRGGWKLSEEVKERMRFRIGFKGKKHSQETKERIRKSLTGFKHSEETRKKLSDMKKGEKAYQWIKDRSKLKYYKQDERRSSIYNTWRNEVRKRDGWKCKIGNSECSGEIEVHHILGWVDHPELRYETNNGITLCKFHHPRKREQEKILSPFFQELIKK